MVSAKVKATRIILAALLGAGVGGMYSSNHDARLAGSIDDTTPALRVYKDRTDQVRLSLKADGIEVKKWDNFTTPIEKVKISVNGDEEYVSLLHVISNPEQYRKEYSYIRKNLSEDTIQNVRKLLKIEPKAYKQLKAFRERESAARFEGAKRGGMKGGLIGAGAAGAMFGAQAIRRKIGNRRQRR